MFALAVIAGAAAIAAAGAPVHYAPVNLAALAIALGIYALAVRRKLPPAGLITLAIAPLALVATLVVGLEIDGVRRWLGSPALALHTGMLVLPSLTVLVARRSDWIAFAASAASALVLALQPDFGTALAFFLALTVAAWHRRNAAVVAAAAMAALAAIACAVRPDPLAPVPFVEGALQTALANGGVLAILAVVALVLAIAAPFRRSGFSRIESRTVAAFLLGLALASLAGAYPTPLLGYGAASIIGYGLALALIEGRRR